MNKKQILFLFLIGFITTDSFAFLSNADATSLQLSEREKNAKNFVIQKNIFPTGASLSAMHMKSVFKNSGLVFVRNLNTPTRPGTLVLLRSATSQIILGSNLRASIAALNMFIPFEGWSIKNAGEAQLIFSSLLDAVEAGSKDIKCEPINTEYRCFYSTSYGYRNTVFMQKSGLLR